MAEAVAAVVPGVGAPSEALGLSEKAAPRAGEACHVRAGLKLSGGMGVFGFEMSAEVLTVGVLAGDDVAGFAAFRDVP